MIKINCYLFHKCTSVQCYRRSQPTIPGPVGRSCHRCQAPRPSRATSSWASRRTRTTWHDTPHTRRQSRRRNHIVVTSLSAARSTDPAGLSCWRTVSTVFVADTPTPLAQLITFSIHLHEQSLPNQRLVLRKISVRTYDVH